MSPYVSYMLGLLTSISILLILWILSALDLGIADAYSKVFCDQVKK